MHMACLHGGAGVWWTAGQSVAHEAAAHPIIESFALFHPFRSLHRAGSQLKVGCRFVA